VSKSAIVSERAASAATGEFDPVLLERFVRRELADPQGEFLIERVAGGQSNPTYFVTLGKNRMVLRKKPAGETLPSAHAVDREHRVLSALAATDVPAPKTILYCGDLSVVGTPFYLMERLDATVGSSTTHPCLASLRRIGAP
jgi:aminoglycoside phosphotransferase (APT) family kinase protein